MQNNDKILTENEPKNSKARIKANGKYLKNNYKRINIAVRPEQADRIKEIAKRFDLSLAQLIIDSVQLYNDTMCNCTSTGADTAQPEQDPTESPMESEETAGTQPEGETETETETETEDEKPEDIPDFVWEQIQRLKKADKRQTAERKAREAAERKRRRIGDIEDY